MLWINPGEHEDDDCYFCVNQIRGTKSCDRNKVRYVETPYTHLPVAHSSESPPLNVCEQDTQQSADPMDVDFDMSTELDQPSASSFVPSQQLNDTPKLVTQTRLDNMCRRL